MAMTTERTIRGNGKWVKIVRYNNRREYGFAVGYQGDSVAPSYNLHLYPFRYVGTWSAAISMAEQMLMD